MSVIPAPNTQDMEDGEFKTSLSYIGRLCLKKRKERKKA
jgi:hypothetical protein